MAFVNDNNDGPRGSFRSSTPGLGGSTHGIDGSMRGSFNANVTTNNIIDDDTHPLPLIMKYPPPPRPGSNAGSSSTGNNSLDSSVRGLHFDVPSSDHRGRSNSVTMDMMDHHDSRITAGSSSSVGGNSSSRTKKHGNSTKENNLQGHSYDNDDNSHYDSYAGGSIKSPSGSSRLSTKNLHGHGTDDTFGGSKERRRMKDIMSNSSSLQVEHSSSSHHHHHHHHDGDSFGSKSGSRSSTTTSSSSSSKKNRTKHHLGPHVGHHGHHQAAAKLNDSSSTAPSSPSTSPALKPENSGGGGGSRRKIMADYQIEILSDDDDTTQVSIPGSIYDSDVDQAPLVADGHHESNLLGSFSSSPVVKKKRDDPNNTIIHPPSSSHGSSPHVLAVVASGNSVSGHSSTSSGNKKQRKKRTKQKSNAGDVMLASSDHGMENGVGSNDGGKSRREWDSKSDVGVSYSSKKHERKSKKSSKSEFVTSLSDHPLATSSSSDHGGSVGATISKRQQKLMTGSGELPLAMPFDHGGSVGASNSKRREKLERKKSGKSGSTADVPVISSSALLDMGGVSSSKRKDKAERKKSKRRNSLGSSAVSVANSVKTEASAPPALGGSGTSSGGYNKKDGYDNSTHTIKMQNRANHVHHEVDSNHQHHHRLNLPSSKENRVNGSSSGSEGGVWNDVPTATKRRVSISKNNSKEMSGVTNSTNTTVRFNNTTTQLLSSPNQSSRGSSNIRSVALSESPPGKNEHCPSRLRAIMGRKQKQSAGSGGSTSSKGKLRRYLFSYNSKKKRQQQASAQQGEKDDKQEYNIKLNPYALNEHEMMRAGMGGAGGANTVISAINEHDILISPNVNNAGGGMEHYSDMVHIPPSLIMEEDGFVSGLDTSGNFSQMSLGNSQMSLGNASANSGSHVIAGSIVSGGNFSNKFDAGASLNSGSHHASLISISELDVLKERDYMGHSSHSEGDANYHRRSLAHSADHLKNSTHSDGTNNTSSLTLSSLGESGHSLPANLESNRFRVPLPVHHKSRGGGGRGGAASASAGGSRSSDDASSMCSTILTSYSTIRSARGTHIAGAIPRGSPGNNTSADDTTHIINLPWSDRSDDKDAAGVEPSARIHGKYTGPVSNDFLQPHGEGTLVIQTGSESLTFRGKWINGKLISPLIIEPEGDGNAILMAKMASAPGMDPSPHNSPIHSHNNNFVSSPHNDTSSVMSSSSKAMDVKYVVNKSNKKLNRSPSIFKSLRYALGEACRTPIDMVIHRSNKKAIQSAALLKKWDQVFIKRSNGLWTVAVMIDRALQPKKPLLLEEEANSKKKKKYGRSRQGDNEPLGSLQARWCTVWDINPQKDELEESMLFAINDDGATKIINRHSWGKYVRRIKI